MTKEEALEFKSRYQAVNEFEVQELRNTSVETKLAQLNSLMSLARAAGWDRKLADDVSEARQRWLRLKGVITGE